MKARPNPLSSIPLLRKRAPDQEEIEALLDLLPDAALLIDAKKGHVLLANARAASTTAFTRQEISEISFESMFPGLDRERFEDLRARPGSSWTQDVLKRSGEQISMQVTISNVGSSGEWALITLVPESQAILRANQRGLEQQRLDALRTLAAAPLFGDLQSAQMETLLAGRQLIGASTLAIYQQEDDDGGPLLLSAILGVVNDLPREISLNDFYHLRKPHVWSPGKRADTELHRLGISARLSYIATAPIRADSPKDGMLLIMESQASPPEDLPVLLEILVGILHTASQKVTISQRLSQKLIQESPNGTIDNTLKDHIKECLVFIDRETRVMDLNTAAEVTLGYSLEDVQGEMIADVIIGAKSIKPAIKAALEGEALQNLGDMVLHRRDGSTVLAHVRVVPIIVGGTVVKVAILITDLSKDEAYRVRVQHLEQQALLGDVAAIFAHEVKNPINNISTGLQLMGMNLQEDDPLQESIQRLQGDCERLAELTKSVLVFSGPREYEMKGFDLGEMLKDLLERWRPRMGRMKVKSLLQVAPDTPLVYGDPQALEQVFTNLINNAIDAMSEEGGMLAIKINSGEGSNRQEAVKISVTDTGRGIPDDVRERIFEPFYTTNKGGTGLGLAITKRIINAHEGHIIPDSFPGGTVFNITLPADEGEQSQQPQGENYELDRIDR